MFTWCCVLYASLKGDGQFHHVDWEVAPNNNSWSVISDSYFNNNNIIVKSGTMDTQGLRLSRPCLKWFTKTFTVNSLAYKDAWLLMNMHHTVIIQYKVNWGGGRKIDGACHATCILPLRTSLLPISLAPDLESVSKWPLWPPSLDPHSLSGLVCVGWRKAPIVRSRTVLATLEHSCSSVYLSPFLATASAIVVSKSTVPVTW